MHNISLTIGDDSGDGHNMTEVVYIKSNVDIASLKEAYKVGKNRIQIDVESHCQDYEDNKFPTSTAKRLLEGGKASEFVTDFIQGCIEEAFDEGDEDNLYIYSSEVYAVLWLCLARIGNPNITIQFDGNYPNIDIGGYGLLWN
jgi:hypothetical protein